MYMCPYVHMTKHDVPMCIHMHVTCMGMHVHGGIAHVNLLTMFRSSCISGSGSITFSAVANVGNLTPRAGTTTLDLKVVFAETLPALLLHNTQGRGRGRGREGRRGEGGRERGGGEEREREGRERRR